MRINRRNFIKIFGAMGCAAGNSLSLGDEFFNYSPRPSGSRYMGGFAAPKLEKIKCAFIGVGSRGAFHAQVLSKIDGAKIVGVCDISEQKTISCIESLKQDGHNPKAYFGNDHAWVAMLDECKPDAVYISTPWSLHAEHAIGAMNSGSHAFVEIPIGVTISECWEIVNTSERTRRHCMLMENVNYGREELLFLNMVRKGLLGELLYGEGAYIHDLRKERLMLNYGQWRVDHWANRNGNLYPCHGIGPISQYMSLAREVDNFELISSYSSPSLGHKAYVAQHLSKNNPLQQVNWRGGDINTSIIKTRNGKVILIQWDETSPRPYTRHNLIQGTKGVLAGFPNRMAVEGVTKSTHEWTAGEDFEIVARNYEHPLYKKLGKITEKMGGHGGMDSMMHLRIVECLKNGTPLDQNVYEGCFWSAIAPLSEASVANEGAPQAFPDFTRGDWRSTKPLGIVG